MGDGCNRAPDDKYTECNLALDCQKASSMESDVKVTSVGEEDARAKDREILHENLMTPSTTHVSTEQVQEIRSSIPNSSSSDLQMPPRSRQLVRGFALCGDDDTRLRPPPPLALRSHPHSQSRESSGTEYTDCSGLDLRTFVSSTLHKNPRDRQMILGLEEQLTTFVNDTTKQAYKFPTMSSYNRMLIHRVAVLFGLDHNVDNSGQCVVVNRTERTALPDFEFSSLIRNNNFTDVKRPYRTFDNNDGLRGPVCLEELHGTPGWGTRRAQSFETSTMTPLGVHSNGNWNARSFDTVAPSDPLPHWNTHRAPLLPKAGSFGGVPGYYHSGTMGLSQRNGVYHHCSSDNGSISHISPRAGVDELTDCMGRIQVDVDHTIPPTLPQMQAHSPNMLYGPPYYTAGQQHTVYVAQPVAQGSVAQCVYPPSAQSLSSNLHSVYPVVQPSPLPYCQPSYLCGQYSGPASPYNCYGYYDNITGIQRAQTGIYPAGGCCENPSVISAEVEVKQVCSGEIKNSFVSTASTVAQTSSSSSSDPHSTGQLSHPAMLSSVDRGYGSMTQE